MIKRRWVLSSFIALACVITVSLSPARAADTDGDGIETVLVPFGMLSNVEFHGALGTVWRGALFVSNIGTEEIWLQAKYGCSTPCQQPTRPGFSGIIGAPGGSIESFASLVYLRAEDGPRTVLSSRLYEMSRAAQPEGVEMPIVREGDFFTHTSAFLAVPGGPAGRAALRVYDPRRVGITVKVDVLQTVNNNAQVVASGQLSTLIDPTPGVSIKLSPGFAAIYDLSTVFPVVNTLDRYDVRVTPITPGAEYWAMVSLTDNATQHVLVITSQ